MMASSLIADDARDRPVVVIDGKPETYGRLVAVGSDPFGVSLTIQYEPGDPMTVAYSVDPDTYVGLDRIELLRIARTPARVRISAELDHLRRAEAVEDLASIGVDLDPRNDNGDTDL